MQATPLPNALSIRTAEWLPDGVGVVTIDCANYIGFIRTPHAIEYDGTVYGRSGWNSDRCCAYYRTDIKPAFVVK